MIDRKTAIRRLTNRYNEQALKYPRMQEDISLELYIRRNLYSVLNSELEEPLADYDKV